MGKADGVYSYNSVGRGATLGVCDGERGVIGLLFLLVVVVVVVVVIYPWRY